MKQSLKYLKLKKPAGPNLQSLPLAARLIKSKFFKLHLENGKAVIFLSQAATSFL